MGFGYQPIERRSHRRFNVVTDTVAFVTNSFPDFTAAGRVTDIGDGGLALSHFGGRLPPHSSLELDIILPGGIANMRKITGDCIWDLETEGELRTKRCGIRFKNLADYQKAFVMYLIQNHTTGKIGGHP